MNVLCGEAGSHYVQDEMREQAVCLSEQWLTEM